MAFGCLKSLYCNTVLAMGPPRACGVGAFIMKPCTEACLIPNIFVFRSFISQVLPAIKAQNPQLQIEQAAMQHRHPKAIAYYRKFMFTGLATGSHFQAMVCHLLYVLN